MYDLRHPAHLQPLRRRTGARVKAAAPSRGGATAGAPVLIAHAVDVFLSDPKVAWRKTTRKGAKYYLASGRFPAFCDAEGLSTLDDLTTDKLGDFLGQLEELGASREYRAKYRQNFRRFAEWCAKTPGYGIGGMKDIERIEPITVPRQRFRKGLAWSKADEPRVVAAAEERGADGKPTRLGKRDRLVGPRTVAVIINSPHNPTGAMYPADLLMRLGEIVEERGMWLISDECYDQVAFDTPHLSLATLRPSRNIISVYSFSKTYGMASWRIGYVEADQRVITAMAAVNDARYTCMPRIGQATALAALVGPQDAVSSALGVYRQRRDMVCSWLDEGGLGYSRPAGGLYVMADCGAAGTGSDELANRLLEERGVAVAPGIAFGRETEGWVRLGLTASEEELEAGIRALCDTVVGWTGS